MGACMCVRICVRVCIKLRMCMNVNVFCVAIVHVAS